MLLSNPFMVDPRVHKEATALVEAGHEVTIIVWDRKEEYSEEETIDGVRVIRIHSKFLRILGHDLFRNPLWWILSYRKAKKVYNNGYKFQVVHCHDLDTLVSGALLKKKYSSFLIFDAHEIFGYMIARTLPKIISKIAFVLEKILLKKVNQIITAEETYNDFYLNQGFSKLTTVLNCKDIVLDSYRKTKNVIFTIIYIGVLNKSRFFPDNIEVIGEIEDVKLIIAGKKENMYEEVKKLSKKFDNIDFIGTISFNEVIPRTLEADVVLCMINPKDINNRIASANKQFEAMVCGKPIICTKGTRSGEITDHEKCGLVVDYTREDLEKAIISLKNNPVLCEKLGRNALNSAIKKYNWGIQKRKLLELYEKLPDKSEI